jgi:predicted nicotinamide N-methyase
MVAWLRTRAADGALVVLADPGRRYAPAGEPGLLATYDVPVDPTLESTAMKRTTLWRL